MRSPDDPIEGYQRTRFAEAERGCCSLISWPQAKGMAGQLLVIRFSKANKQKRRGSSARANFQLVIGGKIKMKSRVLILSGLAVLLVLVSYAPLSGRANASEPQKTKVI